MPHAPPSLLKCQVSYEIVWGNADLMNGKGVEEWHHTLCVEHKLCHWFLNVLLFGCAKRLTDYIIGESVHTVMMSP